MVIGTILFTLNSWYLYFSVPPKKPMQNGNERWFPQKSSLTH